MNFPTTDCQRYVVRAKSTKDFMVLIDDFFLVFDEMEGSFRARVTGSPEIVIKYADLKNNRRLFDELIDVVMPIQQGFLLFVGLCNLQVRSGRMTVLRRKKGIFRVLLFSVYLKLGISRTSLLICSR